MPCDVTRVALVGASHLDLHGRYVRSSEYINALRDFFRAKGFAVTLELGHDPDRDFVFMNGARRLLHAGRRRLLVPRRGRGARAGRHRDLLHILRDLVPDLLSLRRLGTKGTAYGIKGSGQVLQEVCL